MYLFSVLKINYIFSAEHLHHKIMADQKHSEDQHQTKDLLNNSIPDLNQDLNLNPNLSKSESNLNHNLNLKPSTCLVILLLQQPHLPAQPSTAPWRLQITAGKASNSS